MKKRKLFLLVTFTLIIIVAILVFINLPDIIAGFKAGWNSN